MICPIGCPRHSLYRESTDNKTKVTDESSEYDFLNLSIPSAFSGRVSNALVASPTYVKLANLNHFWYSFGLRISDLLEDNAKLQQSLRLAFSQRLIEIFDLGQYEGNVEDKSFESEFKAGMDELEKQRE